MTKTAEAPPDHALAQMRLSAKGVRFIAQWEGFEPRLYNDPLGHCTIGYGHLVHRGRCNGSEPPNFKDGITRAEALELLHEDAARFVRCVNKGVRVRLNQHQFDALVSFSYNVGCAAFTGSTLLRKLNQGRYDDVPAELMRWTNGGLPGLVRRRRAEGRLFRYGDYSIAGETGPELPEGIAGAPEQGPEADISEGPEGSGDPQAPPTGEDGPADEGQHAPTGEDGEPDGEPTHEPDTPVDEGDAEGDRLLVAMRIGVSMGLYISSTTGPGHGANSYHYRRPYRTVVVAGRRYEVGRAADLAHRQNPHGLYKRYFLRIGEMRPTELFYDPMGYSYKNGERVPWIVGDHRDHVHVAF